MNQGTCSELIVERSGHVATLILNRPAKLNAITVAMAREMGSFVREANTDDNVRVVLIRSASERAFSVGSDVGGLAESEYADAWKLRNRVDAGSDYPSNLLALRKPIVAAIRGFCIGGGLEIALACDVRIGGPTSRFAAGEIKLGWHAGSGETQLLPRVVGLGKAMQMLLTGDQIDAEEAHRVGLLQELVPDATVDLRAEAIARSIAANPPIATQLCKHITRMSMNTSLEAGMAYENDLSSWLWTMRDAREGLAAFREKRAPVYTGEL